MKNLQDGRYLMQLDAMVEQLHEVRKSDSPMLPGTGWNHRELVWLWS